MNEYPRDVDQTRDYSDELMLNLDPTLWNGTLHSKEQLMSIIGIYAMRMGDVNTDDSWKNEVDSVHEYKQNAYGYRDYDYSGPVDIIAAGCSQTFGQGIHLEGRWSNVLGDKLGMSVATVAVPGWSTQTSISSVMHYIKRFGKPKIVALLLPDFFRFDTMINSNYCMPESDPVEPKKPVRVTYASRNEPNPNTPRYAKKPYPLDKVLNAEAAFFASGQSLAHFVEYCKEAGITLIWGTWEFRLDYLVRYIKSLDISARDFEFMSKFDWGVDTLPWVELDEYVDIGFYQHENGTVQKFTEMDCHQDLKEKYGDCCFDRGTDKQDHMGVHMHAHIAEKFYDRLKLEKRH